MFGVRVLDILCGAFEEAWERKLREREVGENTKGTAHLKAGKAGSPTPKPRACGCATSYEFVPVNPCKLMLLPEVHRKPAEGPTAAGPLRLPRSRDPKAAELCLLTGYPADSVSPAVAKEEEEARHGAVWLHSPK